MPKPKWLQVWELKEVAADSLLATACIYLQHQRAKGYTPRTLETERSLLGCFLTWCEAAGLCQAQELRPLDIEQYGAYLTRLASEKTQRALAVRTRNRYLGVVSRFGAWLVQQDYLLQSPAAQLRLPKVGRCLPAAVLSHAQVELIMAQADLADELGLRDRAVMELLYSCGIRRNELVTLTLADVDLSAGTVLVRAGKGNKDRLIPLGERAGQWVARYLQEVRPRLAKNQARGPILFLTRNGQPLSGDGFASNLKQYLRAAGITTPGNCHLFRHAMATHMLENGADIRYIQEILGHEDLETTQLYTYLDLSRIKAVYHRTHPGAGVSYLASQQPGPGYQTRRHQTTRTVAPPAAVSTELPSTPGSLAALATQFIQALPMRGYAPLTVAAHRQRLKHLVAWCNDRGLTMPTALTKVAITRYQNQLATAGRRDTGLPLSARYRALLLTTLGLFLDWLVTNHYLLSDLRLSIQLPKCGRRIPRQVLTPEEVEAVLHQPDVTTPLGLRNRAMLETFYATGLRRQELINLNVSDIGFDSGTLRVTAGKGRKDRIVPIGDWALAWVQRYLQEVRPTLPASPEQVRLFISQAGQPLSHYQVNNIVTAAITAAKIGKTGSCHILRHSMATHMLDHGADIRCIQEILGHERLNTTQLYTKVSIRKLKEVHRQTHPATLNPSQDHQSRT